MFSDCHAFFEAVKKESVDAYIPTLVVAEVAFVLSSHYKVPKSKVLQMLESMGSSSGLEILDDLQLPAGIELYKTYHVKLIDCFLASSRRIQEKKASVLSYDRDFDKLGVRRVEPHDLLGKFSKK